MRRLSGYGPGALVLVTTILVLWAGPMAVRRFTFESTSQRMIEATNRLVRNDVLRELNRASRDIADFVEPSVVHISAEQIRVDRWGREQPAISTGSGWIYDADGHIITNYHVIESAVRVEVQLYTGELRPAEIVGFDPFTDIAVLKTRPGGLHPATRADSDQPVQRGDLVFAFGSPFDFRFSMTSGVVSGTGRSVGVIRDARSNRLDGYESFIQIDAAINPGNSGGPLTDYLGRVVAMNTAIATGGRSAEFDEGQFAGIGLAIPLNMVEPVVDQLIATGIVERGYLGVQGVDLTPEVTQELQALGFLGKGIKVSDVPENGPAHAAGVRTDDVITHVNGRVIGSFSELRSEISSLGPGRTIQLRLWRHDDEGAGGSAIDVDVTLVKREPWRLAGGGPMSLPFMPLPELGISRMSTSTARNAERLNVAYREGVLIEDVVEGSRLAAKGVVPGTVIVEVRGFAVSTLDQFVEHLRHASLAHGLLVSVIEPDGTQRRLSLELETG